MMNPRLPNLELIVYKTKELLLNDEKFLLESTQCSGRSDFEVECFPQMWSSTCTGFDVDSNGMPVMAGQAFTKEYTTVVHELSTNWYMVFFGDRPAYLIDKTTDEFLQDLRDKDLACVSKAKIRYADKRKQP
jgi:hypothetical protein